MKIFVTLTLIVICVIGSLSGRVNGNVIYPELEGAWEGKYIGTRIEIQGDQITILYRNRPVLETTFTLLENGEIKYLRLINVGLRYKEDSKDYAIIDKIYLENEQLHLYKTFYIAGEHNEILHKINNSRYGDVTVVDEEILPKLQGFWKAPNSSYILEIKGNKLICRYKDDVLSEDKITVVHYNDETDPNLFSIINKDPARLEGVCMFTNFTYQDDKLSAYEIIFDDDSPRLEFEKIK